MTWPASASCSVSSRRRTAPCSKRWKPRSAKGRASAVLEARPRTAVSPPERSSCSTPAASRGLAGYGRQAGLYALPAGDRGRVALQQVDDRWRVWHTEGREQRLVADGLDLEYAQGVAEDLVRRMGALVLAQRGSDWRSLTASENQLRVLTQMGVEVSGEITRGEGIRPAIA